MPQAKREFLRPSPPPAARRHGDVRLLVVAALAVSVQAAGYPPDGRSDGSGGDGASAQEASAQTAPPVARKIPEQLDTHGHTRIDNYYWLNQRENPEVITYLEEENRYTDALMAHTTDRQAELFDEIKGRIRQTDLSVPARRGDYFYYTRTEEGRDYPLYARKRGSLDAAEEVILDVNELAEGHDYFAAFPSVSSSGDMMAWAEDTQGRRIYTIRIRNLATGQTYPEAIDGASGNMVWAEDDETLFYARRDPQTLRSYQIYRHRAGTDPAGDALVFEETDEEFSTRVRKTKSKRFLIISSSHTLMDEHRYLDARAPEGDFTLFLPRQREHEHSLDHLGDHFYVRTNRDGASNFQLMRAPVESAMAWANGEGAAGGGGESSVRGGSGGGRGGDRVSDAAIAAFADTWEPVVPHRRDVFLQGFELFGDHLVLSEREAGLTRLRVREWDGGEHQIAFDEPAYLAYLSENPELDTDVLRFGYTSLSAPRAVYDYNMTTRERTLLKEDEVLGGYDRTDYAVERLHVPARDGAVEIPVSLVYRRGLERNGENPLLLYAYGSYGASTEPTFVSARLSLIDRGFVYAIAHIRGGQELGREWYEDGKMFNKKNTFTDYVDVADFLVEEGYTSPEKLFARGGSAGGLLMGAVVNMRPELFRGVVAHVPFVDVVTTMLDETIPLTTFEWDEWGNPSDLESYRYMLSYSPYDQVEAKDYPNMLVTTGLHDSQVQYWEPAKWVAKLRAMKTDDNRLLLKTHMDAGHGGGSGRDRQYEELAFEFAFLLDLLEEGS